MSSSLAVAVFTGPHCPVNQLGMAVCCSKTARACPGPKRKQRWIHGLYIFSAFECFSVLNSGSKILFYKP